MNTNETFLHSTKHVVTVSFRDLGNGSVELSYQQTLDPNEECNEETLSTEDARKEWKKFWSQGYRKATGWHTCKRDSAWANNGDEY